MVVEILFLALGASLNCIGRLQLVEEEEEGRGTLEVVIQRDANIVWRESERNFKYLQDTLYVRTSYLVAQDD